MKNQLILFEGNGEAYARAADPETSEEAAGSMRGEAAGRVERIVLDALTRLGGSGTAYEIELEVQRFHPDIDSNTTSPRMKPLERKNLVERTSSRGPGRGTRQQIVWRSTDGVAQA